MQRAHRPAERTALGRALQLDIAPLAVSVHDLAKQDCAAVPEPRNEIAELIPRIGHRDRFVA